MIREKFIEQNGKCEICKQVKNLKDCQGDHIIEWSKGGLTTYDNLQVLL